MAKKDLKNDLLQFLQESPDNLNEEELMNFLKSRRNVSLPSDGNIIKPITMIEKKDLKEQVDSEDPFEWDDTYKGILPLDNQDSDEEINPSNVSLFFSVHERPDLSHIEWQTSSDIEFIDVIEAISRQYHLNLTQIAVIFSGNKRPLQIDLLLSTKNIIMKYGNEFEIIEYQR